MTSLSLQNVTLNSINSSGISQDKICNDPIAGKCLTKLCVYCTVLDMRIKKSILLVAHFFSFHNEAGQCPPVGPRPECPETPNSECLRDSECQGTQKCCQDPCGGLQCVDAGMYNVYILNLEKTKFSSLQSGHVPLFGLYSAS